VDVPATSRIDLAPNAGADDAGRLLKNHIELAAAPHSTHGTAPPIAYDEERE